MKKKSFYLCSLFAAALMFTGCTDSEVVPDGDGKLGELRFTLNFEGTNDVNNRAATKSTAIPVTSWKNVKNLQVLLVNQGTGLITSGRTVTVDPAKTTQTEAFTNVLVGDYDIVAVANVVSPGDNVWTYGTAGANVEAPWSAASMVGKSIDEMIIKHAQTTTWPSHISATDPIREASRNKKLCLEPSEIFMGYSTGSVVKINEGETTETSISLKREVSLMRVRMDVSHKNVENVLWTEDANIFIYRLPVDMKIKKGNTGGISTTSNPDLIQISTGYNTADPAVAEYSPNKILADNFTLWKDIRVFPNNGGRTVTDAADADAQSKYKYFIVVSARGKKGHKYADGSDAEGKPIYWYNSIAKNFVKNNIREVNLTITTGGYKEIPVDPKTYGNITVTFGAVEQWNKTILTSEIIL